jgi:hypothetical protein
LQILKTRKILIIKRMNPAQEATYAASGEVDARANNIVRRRRSFLNRRGFDSLAGWVPLIIAAAYLVVFLLQLQHNLVALTWNSDVASAFTLPETLVRTGTGGHTVLASTGSYIPLWFELFGGYLGGQRATGELQSLLGIAVDVVVGVALLALSVRTVARLVRSAWRRQDDETTTPGQLARTSHVVYWTASAASTAAAFELSVMADGVHAQYYATLVFSVAAVVPLLMRPASLGRWLVPLGASIFFAASLVGLFSVDLGGSRLQKEEPGIVKLAEANHATTGYAGYWYASNLTWNSGERIRVRPVSLCENPTGADFCPFYINRVPSWYVPNRRRTFLLVNPEEEYLSEVPKGLGKPIASYAIDESTEMYVYPYNIASRLGTASD